MTTVVDYGAIIRQINADMEDLRQKHSLAAEGSRYGDPAFFASVNSELQRLKTDWTSYTQHIRSLEGKIAGCTTRIEYYKSKSPAMHEYDASVYSRQMNELSEKATRTRMLEEQQRERVAFEQRKALYDKVDEARQYLLHIDFDADKLRFMTVDEILKMAQSNRELDAEAIAAESV